jgi:hypothetical protein
VAKYTAKEITYGSKYHADLFARSASELRKTIANNRKQLVGIQKQLDNTKLDIGAKLGRDVALLLESHSKTRLNYQRLAKDNDEAESDTSMASLINMQRERSDTLSQTLAQGGGETDQLKAQAVALRNWSANQQNTNRSYADSLTSINNSISDTNSQTQGQLQNVSEQADAAERQAFNEYKLATGNVYSTNVDIYGQMAEHYTNAADAFATKKATAVTTGKKNTTTKQYQSASHTKAGKKHLASRDAVYKEMHAEEEKLANLNGQTYTSTPKTPQELGFQETSEILQKQNSTELSGAQTLQKQKGPEGATLRKR